MNQDANAILALCSHLCMAEGTQPLEPREYSRLATLLGEAGKTPKDLFDLPREELSDLLGGKEDQVQRILRLLERSGSLGLTLGQYRNMGIDTVTRADPGYPRQLKKKLANGCPPLFYCAGDLSLAEGRFIGYVGSRNIQQEDLDFTLRAVKVTTSLGYGVVSGGARGIDTVAGREALRQGSRCMEYLSDSLMKKLKDRDVIRGIQDGTMLLLSSAKPEAGFQVGLAMMRNRYIYAQSQATVVVRTDAGKGGTWAGAVDNLKNGYSPTLCREHPYPGNQALLQQGAVPIGDNWDGTIPETATPPGEAYVQTSLFDG